MHVQQGRRRLDGGVREHGQEARTPLAAFFNIPIEDVASISNHP